MADREKLIALIKQKEECLCDLCGRYDTRERSATEIADHLISNGVTVQKHGRWVPADGEGETSCDEWDCSICERRLTFAEEMETDEVYELNHYCPNCGAKMDLEVQT